MLAMAEWPPLYRALLFIPANILAFFRGGEYAEAAGVYTFPDFILDYSCSGIHFFIVAFLMYAVAGRGLVRGFVSCYLVTLTANTFRVALFLKLLPFSAGRPWLHEVIGTAVFIFFLISFYWMIHRQVQHAESV